MKFYSTNNKNHRVDLRTAVIQGLAPDNGLYMPEHIPVLDQSLIQSLPDLSFQQIGFEVARAMLGNDLPETQLQKIVEHTLAFDSPLVEVESNVFSLELFHGPTLAFKDFGARFLAGLLGYFAKEQDREITILVATSGDTGSAVANAFLNVPGTRVVVLYPSGKVSVAQEKQFTTLGGNITALEVNGTFDDCQRLVKQAFLDADLKQKFFLTSANSINIARLIPQSFYYFRAYAQLKTKKDVVFAVPSGNFGNLTAGLLAKRMGLPIANFVAATNANDVVPEYLKTEKFYPRPSVQTISNAMDVGNPSNFVRMLDLFQHDFKSLTELITGFTFTDAETREAMLQLYDSTGYIMDPHGAVGYLGLKQFLKSKPDYTGIFLETAHPAKFADVVEATLETKVELPERLQKFMRGEKKTVIVSAGFDEFREVISELLG
ncbi:MAG TPA: threonine synthase [Cyclobacteriaceae bacterium]|nr:threonine synthase [Cyclobacteriaceae bacterium]